MKPICFTFSLDDKPNIFGMHENSNITVFLSTFKGMKEHIRVPNIVEIIEHECIHYCIDALLEEQIEWQKQDRVIGHIMRMRKK